MNRFTVTYTQSALDDLANLWLGSHKQQEIADAANEVDRLLAENQHAQGIEMHEGMMQFYVGDFVVQFSIEDADRTVTVWSARLIRR